MESYVITKNCSPGKAIKHMVLLQVILSLDTLGRSLTIWTHLSRYLMLFWKGRLSGCASCARQEHFALHSEVLFSLAIVSGTWLDHFTSFEYTCSNFWGKLEYVYVLGEYKGKRKKVFFQKLRSVFVFQSSLFSCEKPTLQNKKRDMIIILIKIKGISYCCHYFRVSS